MKKHVKYLLTSWLLSTESYRKWMHKKSTNKNNISIKNIIGFGMQMKSLKQDLLTILYIINLSLKLTAAWGIISKNKQILLPIEAEYIKKRSRDTCVMEQYKHKDGNNVRF